MALAALLASGCGVGAKQRIVAIAMDRDTTRAETMEATLRVLDEHPEYVGELFRAARRHPATLERFMAAAVADLDERALAELVARYLAQNPASLEEIFIRTLEASERRPAARAAIGRAIAARRAIAAGIITDDEADAERMLLATLDLLVEKPAAERAFLRVMEARAPELASLIAAHPRTLHAMMRAILGVGPGAAMDTPP